MVFRILTDGSRFRAQYRFFLWWRFLKKFWSSFSCCGTSPMEFNSDEDAVLHIREEYGNSALIVRPWHVSLAAKSNELDKPAHNKRKPTRAKKNK